MNNLIMLVEDEVKTAEMLTQALQTESIDVVWVADGTAAVEAMAKGKFDLVILDLKLPGMTGDDVLEKIRKIDPYVEVVIYTNYQDPPVMKKLINLGIEGYISKGASADLWETVERVKSILDPFNEDERASLRDATPEGTFSDLQEKK
jgi:DNA-binding NarL/FixJ family response regulator